METLSAELTVTTASSSPMWKDFESSQADEYIIVIGEYKVASKTRPA